MRPRMVAAEVVAAAGVVGVVGVRDRRLNRAFTT